MDGKYGWIWESRSSCDAWCGSGEIPDWVLWLVPDISVSSCSTSPQEWRLHRQNCSKPGAAEMWDSGMYAAGFSAAGFSAAAGMSLYSYTGLLKFEQ